MKKNKQTNPQSYVYRCSDQQKGAQILPLAHPALHNKVFIPSGYGKARILQILRIDDLFEPCIVQIPIQRRTQKTHTHTHTHTVLPSYQTSCNNKTPRRRRRSRNTKAGTTKETKTNDWKKEKRKKKKTPDGKKKRCSRTQRITERDATQREREKKRKSASKRERARGAMMEHKGLLTLCNSGRSSGNRKG